MSFFPFFADISGKRCLVAGGGVVALRRIKTLLPFAPKIHVTAETVLPEIREISGLEISERAYRDSDLDDADFVIAATDNRETNAHISERCRLGKIPCSTVDEYRDGTLVFPAVVKNGDITIGISTSGKSPLLASRLRREIERLVTDKTAEVCSLMGFIRPYVMSRVPDENRRAELMAAALDYCCEKLPDRAELIEYIDNLETDI